MKLLLDAGNSQLKWAFSVEGSLQNFGQATYQDLSALKKACIDHPQIQAAFACAVCGPEKQQIIQNICPIPIQWQFSSKEALGVYNHYQNITEHGADRWFNVLGARFFTQNAAIVVSCGTAIAIEVLTQDHHYLGGSIAPGLWLMQNALKTGTANLNRDFGVHQNFATNTADAMATGVIDAACGNISLMLERLKTQCTPHPVDLILTGGDANILLPFLDKNAKIIDNLALHGLNHWVENI